jgi:transcriptional regulator with XRE-family HTH domain
MRLVVLPDEVDVMRIRKGAGMSQAEFSRAFCINPRTLQEWEQGRRKPDATTRAYLAVIANIGHGCTRIHTDKKFYPRSSVCICGPLSISGIPFAGRLTPDQRRGPVTIRQQPLTQTLAASSRMTAPGRPSPQWQSPGFLRL